MPSDFFGCNFFSSEVHEFQYLVLNKETLLGYLFADIHCVSKKREKGNTVSSILIVSVQITTAICTNIPQSACVAQVVSVFPPVKIKTDESRFEAHSFWVSFFFLFLLKDTLFYHYCLNFSTTNCKPKHLKSLKRKKIFALSKKSLNILLHQALQL